MAVTSLMLKDFLQVFINKRDDHVSYGPNYTEHRRHYLSDNSGEASDYATREFGPPYEVLS